jgi:protease secretion system membrane fusion protein
MANRNSPEAPHAPVQRPANSPSEPTHPVSDTGRAARLGLWVLGLGFGGFLLWAAIAPLDEGVPTQGMVTIDTKRKAVQHLSGGIVRQVLVREGEVVREGQPVILLDEAVARANYESVRQRYLGLRAMEGRLLAEQQGATGIVFHPDLQETSGDPLIRTQMNTQQQLFNSRRAALRADLQAIEESVQGQQALLQAYEGILASRRSHLSLLQEELGHIRELVKEGYAPRNRQLELERLEAESQAVLTELMGNITRTQRSIAELRQRAVSRQQEYRKEVEQQLSEVTREVQSDAEKYVAVRADLERTEIRSPASGQVVGLAIQTVGGVVQAGQKLMDVVPEDEPLLLEARIEPHLIDKVRTGLLTDVRFSAFSHAPQLVVEGEVVSVSSDLLTDPQTGVSYYLARVVVTEQGMQALGKRRMQPGMPVEVIIKTGERSVLTYLMSPLTKRVAASMTEE